MRPFRFNRATACVLLATTTLCAPSVAHAGTAPKFASPDANGVDLTTGLVFFAFEEGGIGSGEGAVRMQRIWAEDAGFVDNWSGGLFTVTSGGITKTHVQIAGINDVFTQSGGVYTSEKADGATLVILGNTNYLYTAREGTKIEFLNSTFTDKSLTCPGADVDSCSVPLSIVRPNGLKFTMTWNTARMCVQPVGVDCAEWMIYRRLASVTSSSGYSLTITYLTNSPGTGTEPIANWWKRTIVTFGNSANPPSPAPTISYAYPSADITDITDPAGRVWRLTKASGKITGVRRPGSASDNIAYAYGGDGLVSSATRDGVTATYERSVSGSTGTMTVTNALSQQSVVTSDLNLGRPTSFRDALNRTTSFQYDANARPTRTTEPEGNYVQLTYDSRGNATQTRAVAKSGSGLADIVASASFDSTCSNVVKCNKPNSTTDPRGNVTDYTYDATHGGPLTATLPAPVGGGVRPQTRYSYTGVTSASGVVVQMLTGVSACQTTASCTGAVDETKLTAAYNSNLLATSVTRANGTGTLAATSAMTYDPRGNLLTVDGPLPGTADTTRYRYDAADQLNGTTSPDPDGAGALKNRAVRLTYRPDGQVSKQELGTVNSQSDPDWALFAPLETVDITFDSNSRATTQKLSGGGTDFALTQFSYDALGRLDCSAVRMNTAIYGSLPASACTLGTQGSFGPDRISKTIYDAAGQVTQQQVAVGTTDVATERTLTYTANAMLATLKDAEANLTTYEYDGHDRLAKTRFPLPTKGSNASSTTDYEQLTYDAASNITSRRLRDTQTIAFAYDNLNRPTLKDLPGTEPDVSYAYDNLGRLTSASQTGNALSFTYDALSRNLTQVGPQGTVSSQWDLAGRRTQLTYPGTGLFVDHDYLVTGETTKIRENGATSGVGVLATYGYDDLGRRTSTTFGNGAVQAFAYDPVSRLASLSNDLTGTANDLSATFAYNPASQIAANTRTGDPYAWTGHFNENKTGSANGLNQLTSVGAKSLTHDARGNVTAFGTKAFTYSSENLLATGPNSTTLAYDPLLRLYQTVSGATTSRFAYDGLDRIAEHDGSNALQRRYVHGPGMDEPLVWYEGSGTTDRRFLGSDERGSIVSVTDSAGALLGFNKYDEFGQPQSTNLGVWGYTGQAWLPTLGVWHYKARAYDPELGRFLQTDPIGYEDSANLYAYVLNDPMNLVDPLGLDWRWVCVVTHGFGTTCGFAGYQNPTIGWTATLDRGLRNPSDRASNEGGATGEDITVTAKRKPESVCAKVAKESGAIRVDSIDVKLVLLAGLSHQTGTFTNLRTGSTGHFSTWGLSLGIDLGFSGSETYYRSVGSFLGYSETLSAGGGIRGVGTISASRSQNVHGQVTGLGIGFAPPTPVGLGRVGASVTAGDTFIYNCKVGR